jgi:GAF domain-containing protein
MATPGSASPRGDAHRGRRPSLVDVGLHEADGLVVGPEAGVSGTAAFRREPVVTTDVASDPLWRHSRPMALGRGIRAAWATPIIAADGDRVLGVLTVYFDERDGLAPRPGGGAVLVARVLGAQCDTPARRANTTRLSR